MKILQIVPSISLVYGGPSQMVLGLSKALADANIDVTILTTNSNGDVGQPPLDVPLYQPLRENGYHIIYFPCYPWRRYKFSIELICWLFQHASEYDLAHIHGLFSPVSTLAATVARWQNLPYIIRPFGTLDRADLQKKKLLKTIYVTLLEKANLAGAAAIHFTSSQEAKVSERFGVKTPDLIIPLGVPIFAQQQSLKNNPIPQILFLSRIEPKKGIELLIIALENLLIEGQKFHFILAGSNSQDPQYEAEIIAKIDNLANLKSQITITGFVSGKNKQDLLEKADLFVLPSYYENFGIAVAEAMAAGIPVVISDRVYIYEDILQAKAGWVCHCDVVDLTEKLRLALLNPQERLFFGKNAQDYARINYSWASISKSCIDAYHQILSIKEN